VKIAAVVQRYGPTINGGAELHARYIAEHLARHVEVEVLTTCATDYVTWQNELPAGTEQIAGVTVRRFPVDHERSPVPFARLSEQVFERRHSLADELAWLEAEGPASSSLVGHVARQAIDVDFFLFFSYRYFHAYHGARATPSRALLVPTAERDPAIGLSLFRPIFGGVRALMYNSPEERAMIQAVAANEHVPSVVVGVGSDVPGNPQPARFRQKFNVRGPFVVYVGRIDENKGCLELFRHFEAYTRAGGTLSLVLIGQSVVPIPNDPRIRHLGFLSDSDKFDAVAASDLLVMPSYFESLSMVALEAWALGRPVFVNGHCDVLKGQCLRSNAGLYYHDGQEFIETLKTFERNQWLNVTLGRNGRRFYREHYDWAVIERKYLEMFDRLGRERPTYQMMPLPGWLGRRRRACPPASAAVRALPQGPVRTPESARVRSSVAGSLPVQRPETSSRIATSRPRGFRPRSRMGGRGTRRRGTS
jgi:glycosyltransferase involved in cell wall biosynthesis